MRISPETRAERDETARQLRKAIEDYQRAKNKEIEEENKIIRRMFDEISSSEVPLSAKEISAQLNEDMSWQEVSGQMVLATSPHQKIPKHTPTKKVQHEKSIQRSIRTTTKVFAELDENGNIKKGGDIVVKTKTNVVYGKWEV